MQKQRVTFCFTLFAILIYCTQNSQALELNSSELSTEACWVRGLCKGTVSWIEGTNTKEECLSACQSNANCEWFTYHIPSKACVMYENCPTLDESCISCVTGKRTCPPPGNEK